MDAINSSDDSTLSVHISCTLPRHARIRVGVARAQFGDLGARTQAVARASRCPAGAHGGTRQRALTNSAHCTFSQRSALRCGRSNPAPAAAIAPPPLPLPPSASVCDSSWISSLSTQLTSSSSCSSSSPSRWSFCHPLRIVRRTSDNTRTHKRTHTSTRMLAQTHTHTT